MNLPFCSHPKVIFNRQFDHLVFSAVRIKYGKSSIDVDRSFVDDYFAGKYDSFFNKIAYSYQVFLDRHLKSNPGSLPPGSDDFFVVTESGFCFDLLKIVPCRHCKYCKFDYASRISNQVTYEVQDHAFHPYFLLLTYNNPHLVSPTDLDYSHIQNFFKRLRQCFVRQKLRSANFKHVTAGEFGDKKHRPHWHVILFGIDPTEFSGSGSLLPHKLKQYINYCWRDTCSGGFVSFDDYRKFNYPVFNNFSGDPLSYGFSNIKYVNRPFTVSMYLTKYICKQGFRVSHSINLGLRFVEKFRDVIARQGRFDYMNRHDGRLCSGFVSGYYLKKLFPLVHDVFPTAVRRQISLGLSQLNNYDKYWDHYNYGSNLIKISSQTSSLDDFPDNNLNFHIDPYYKNNDLAEDLFFGEINLFSNWNYIIKDYSEYYSNYLARCRVYSLFQKIDFNDRLKSYRVWRSKRYHSYDESVI